MKHKYENFTEIAQDFTKGENWTHQLSEHSSDECPAWQHGVLEFAKWLDTSKIKLVKNEKIYDRLWKEYRTYKPKLKEKKL